MTAVTAALEQRRAAPTGRHRSPLARTRPSRRRVGPGEVAGREPHPRQRARTSTTLGGVPRVWRGPCTHCTAAYGGTRSSTVLPGTRSASRRASSRQASRRAPRSGSSAAATARASWSTSASGSAAGSASGSWAARAATSWSGSGARAGTGVSGPVGATGAAGGAVRGSTGRRGRRGRRAGRRCWPGRRGRRGRAGRARPGRGRGAGAAGRAYDQRAADRPLGAVRGPVAELPAHPHRAGAAAVEVDRLHRAEVDEQPGELPQAHAGAPPALPAVHDDEQGPAVAGHADGGARGGGLHVRPRPVDVGAVHAAAGDQLLAGPDERPAAGGAERGGQGDRTADLQGAQRAVARAPRAGDEHGTAGGDRGRCGRAAPGADDGRGGGAAVVAGAGRPGRGERRIAGTARRGLRAASGRGEPDDVVAGRGSAVPPHDGGAPRPVDDGRVDGGEPDHRAPRPRGAHAAADGLRGLHERTVGREGVHRPTRREPEVAVDGEHGAAAGGHRGGPLDHAEPVTGEDRTRARTLPGSTTATNAFEPDRSTTR